jgi:endonuclease/exonuclease/phosphatase family metal-dependent hydrolase
MKKVAVVASLAVLVYLMKATLWSSKCRAPILVELLHPELPARPEGPFTVVTLNMAGSSSLEAILEEFQRLRLVRDADVVFLQEVVHSEAGRTVLPSLVERLRLHAFFATSTETRVDGVQEGIAILSRRPVRDPHAFDLLRFGLHFRSRCRVALAATVETGHGRPVRAFGVHLDTRLNPAERIAQLGPVLEEAKRFDGPVILGGDFNTNDVYWLQHVVPLPYLIDQSKAMQRFLASHGFLTPMNGSTPTFDYFRFRLDWIFLRSLRASHWGIEPVRFSDHHAVWMELEAPSPDSARR